MLWWPDSIALLVLSKIKALADFTLEVAHVNYGLRLQESQKDESLLERLLKSLGLVGHFYSVTTEDYKKKKNAKLGLEISVISFYKII